MPIRDLRETLAEYGDDFLVLDFNRLFISSTLREEAWLLSQRDDPELVDSIIDDASRFGIQGVRADRDLITYSGGEQAILATLLTTATLRSRNLLDKKILLVNVLDSLSADNRRRLVALVAGGQGHHSIAIYENRSDGIVEVAGSC